MKANIGDIILNHNVSECNIFYKAIVISTNKYCTKAITVDNNEPQIFAYTPDFETNSKYEVIGHIDIAELITNTLNKF